MEERAFIENVGNQVAKNPSSNGSESEEETGAALATFEIGEPVDSNDIHLQFFFTNSLVEGAIKFKGAQVGKLWPIEPIVGSSSGNIC